MSVSDFLARLQGKRAACGTTEDLVQLLDEQYGRLCDTRLPLHLQRVARLEELPAFQPEVLDLRAAAADLALQAEALITAAGAAGHTDLAERLVDSAESLHESVSALTAAAHATAPADRTDLAHTG